MRNLELIAVGDRVWVESGSREKRLRTVEKVTPTQIILDGAGEFDRYNRQNGVQRANLTWRGHLDRVASPAEVRAWDRTKEAERIAKKKSAAEKVAKEEREKELRQLFFPRPVSVHNSDKKGTYEFSIHGLTESQVRKLAELITSCPELNF